MNAYATEEEQLQALMNWLKKYGIYIALAIALVVVIFVGRSYWLTSNAEYLAESSVLFDEFQGATDKAKQTKLANNLFDNYQSTVYGKVAALYLASLDVTAKKWDKALTQYKWAYENTSQWPELQIIAFENLVRAELELKNTTKAQELVDKLEQSPSSMSSVDLVKTYPINFYNLKGDVLFANNKKEEAVTAYNKALVAINLNPMLAEQIAQFANWITLKRNDLLAARPLK